MHDQPTPETRRIPLRRHDGTIRAYALVDAGDYEWLNTWRWSLNGGYAIRRERHAGKQRSIRMHRQILGLEPGDKRQGDHRNRDRLDCRRENLRIAARGEKDNRQNVTSYAGSSSRFRGVSWDQRTRKWRAAVKVDGKGHWLGRFGDEMQAAAVAAAFRREHMPFSDDAAAA